MNSTPQPTLASRIRGALYGALVGDALGLPVEFSTRAERDADPVVGMGAWGMHHQPAGTWSDDGALVPCTAEGVRVDFSKSRLEGLYVRWMTEGRWAAHGEVFDIGNATRAALGRLADGVPIERAGETGEGQNGNGSLMRILPVALRFHRSSPSQLAEMAMAASAITHAHVRSQLACAFYCQVVVELLRGIEPLVAYRNAIAKLSPLFEAHPREQNAFARLLTGDLPNTPRADICASGYVIHTLEAALWCLLTQPCLSSAVLAAGNLGDDTDTTGCVAGGLAGAAYGVGAVPPEWLAALPRRRDLDSLIGDFVAACLTHEHTD
jgi:ADP-ribosyl-[dinitrogen reductase] hydrolase